MRAEDNTMNETTVEYKVTITRLTKELKTNRKSYEQVGTAANGDAKYDYVPAPDKVETDSVTLLEVRVPTIDLAEIFEAVSSD